MTASKPGPAQNARAQANAARTGTMVKAGGGQARAVATRSGGPAWFARLCVKLAGVMPSAVS